MQPFEFVERTAAEHLMGRVQRAQRGTRADAMVEERVVEIEQDRAQHVQRGQRSRRSGRKDRLTSALYEGDRASLRMTSRAASAAPGRSPIPRKLRRAKAGKLRACRRQRW